MTDKTIASDFIIKTPIPDVAFKGVSLGLNLKSLNGSGGNGGDGSSGSSGSSGGGNRGRYVESMGRDGKIWGTCTSNTGAMAWEGYKATNPNNQTQQYYRPTTGGPTHHTTLHRDGNYNVHGTNGSTTRY